MRAAVWPVGDRRVLRPPQAGLRGTASLVLAFVSLFALSVARASEPAPTAEQIEFFEKRIRPVLYDSCYGCHSVESGRSRGGLLLDTHAGLLKGGESGAAIVPGDPDASLLIRAIRFTEKELQMPPESAGGQLPPEQIADLEAWVRLGAPDPRTGRTTAADTTDEDPLAAAREHWAFQRVETPPVPPVKDAAWVRTPVDAFVLAKLEANELRPAPPADRRTLLRRVYYDLTGLPPSPQEMADFLNDPSPGVYEQVVERLLASPRYGERWGRHWLDVARYADTKGYVFQEERRYAFSYTYRDYVIRAFNEDKPYDQFLLEQLAADRLLAARAPGASAPDPDTATAADDRASLAALGYLTLGRRFLNNQNDIIDDRIDVVMRGTQGLTVSCARCHDHKFDPISIADYYALHGVFASSREPDEKPLLGGPLDAGQHESFLKAQAKIEAQREEVIEAEVQKWLTEQRGKRADYLRAAQAALELPADAKLDTFAGEQKVVLEVLRQWMALLKERAPDAGPPADSDAPPDLSGAEVRRIIARHLDNQTVKQRQELAALEWQHPGAPARAMAMEDHPKPRNSRVFIRGNARNPGTEVPRRFLTALAGPEPAPFTDGSGRLELARAIASRDNPLTARVFVNRVWGWRFGAPLVSTTSDFGIRTESPVHRELLDWLAASFMDDGWSVKQLHRWMLLSNTYRQASALDESLAGVAAPGNPQVRAAEVDPENTLLWRQNRRRLDFESLRDSLLTVSGQLNLTPGGQATDILTQPFSGRRTVYGFIDRQNLPGLFRTFDFANPDASSPGRFATTVPQQALFMLNSPFVIEQARALAAWAASVQANADPVGPLFERVLQRPPDPNEAELGRAFLARPVEPMALALGGWEYGTGRFDEEAKATTDFAPITVFNKGRVSPEKTFPLKDERGYASLTPTGGHPGSSARFAVVRRWIAPVDGLARISGKLRHDNAQGDGVRARLVAQTGGLLAEWRAHNSATATTQTEIPVRAGEALDFIVDCVGSPDFDSFTWSPVVRFEPRAKVSLARVEWNAEADFGPPKPVVPPLTPLEQFAQVLLLSNEFAFVD